MARVLNVAAVQMDANPAPAGERLARAERLVASAARAGARLVVLPELFNSGYSYDAAAHGWAEPPDGPTVIWMREAAARLGVHLAGSLLLRERGEVFNALWLFDPAGRSWRTDKAYPWGWERALFRGRRGVTVARTELGDLGMLLCWDSAHRRLWRQYAGRVDLMLLCSCPPDVPRAVFDFPGGLRAPLARIGPMARLEDSVARLFGDMVGQQTAWLGVPAVNSGAVGRIGTPLPGARANLLVFALVAPWLLRHLRHAERARMSADLFPSARVVGADGRVLAQPAAQEETFAVAEVELADERPRPRGPQPRSTQPWLAYLLSDGLLPLLSLPAYRRGVV